MEKIRGLYKITNEYSGLFYIGKSVDIYKRSILDKSIIPDIVTPDDIFYHTESLI